MCCSHLCAIMRITSHFDILILWNVVWDLKSSVILLRTLNSIQWSTLMLFNCSNLSIDVLLTLLCNFAHNFVESYPYLMKPCATPKIKCYTFRTLNRVQLKTLILWNCWTLSIDLLLTFLCNLAQNFTYSKPFLIKRCVTPKIESYTLRH